MTLEACSLLVKSVDNIKLKKNISKHKPYFIIKAWRKLFGSLNLGEHRSGCETDESTIIHADWHTYLYLYDVISVCIKLLLYQRVLRTSSTQVHDHR